MKSKVLGKVVAGSLIALGSASCGNINPYAAEEPLRIPKLKLLTPSAVGETADAGYTIQVEFEKVVLTDTWTISYVSDAMPTIGGDIGADLPVTVRTIRWDTTQMASGNYYLHGHLKSLNGTFAVTAAGSLRIDHPVAAGNTAPTVTLAQPNGGEILARGETTTIAWDAADADGDVVTSKIEISRDSGATWTELVASATSPYDWAVPADQTIGPHYKIRVVASDTPHGATRADSSNAVFSIR